MENKGVRLETLPSDDVAPYVGSDGKVIRQVSDDNQFLLCQSGRKKIDANSGNGLAFPAAHAAQPEQGGSEEDGRWGKGDD